MNAGRQCHAVVMATLVIASGYIAAVAGERTNVRGLGMGGASVALSSGTDAVGVNPANLALPEGGKFSLSLLPVAVRVGSDFLTYGLYTRYFTGVATDSGRVGRNLSDADKSRIFNGFPGDVGRVEAVAEARPVGLMIRMERIGTFALTVTETAGGDMILPHDYARFLLYGNPLGSSLDFTRTRAQASWLREYAVSFGRDLPPLGPLQSLTGGISLKIIHGYGYYELGSTNTRLVTSSDGTLRANVNAYSRSAGVKQFEGDGGPGYSLFPAPAGSGLGLDLGVAGRVNEFLRLGFSVTDVGSIRWKRGLEESRCDTVISVDDPFNSNLDDLIHGALKATTREGTAFSTGLPTTFRLGFGLALHKLPLTKGFLFGELDLAVEFDHCVEETPLVPRGSRFSVGMEYRPWEFLPLRTGVSVGGPGHGSLALGIGLHLGVFVLDVASEDIGWLFSRDTFSYGSAAVGMRLQL